MFRKPKDELVIKPVLEIPREVFDILQVVDAEYLIVEPGDTVIAHSVRIESLGVIKDGKVVNEGLRQLIRQARRNNELNQANIEIANNETRARAFHVGNAGNIAVLVFDDAESLRLDATRRDFVANISHELKTPIGGISILAEAISEGSEDPTLVKNFSERMKIEANRLSHLVQEIIDLSRIQDQNTTLNSEIVSLTHIIEESIYNSKVRAEKRSIDVNFSHEGDIEFFGDRKQLVIAISNLIENAINYSPERTKVNVVLRKNGDIAEIAISDQGVGIAEADLDRIFERFYRVDQARSRETGGTGLGLSIVKHVISNHGGDVQVWSVPGTGSTFTVLLPLVENQEESK